MKKMSVSKRYTSLVFLLMSFFSFVAFAGERIPIGEFVSLPIPAPEWKHKYDNIAEPTANTIRKWSHLKDFRDEGELELLKAVNAWVNSQVKYTVDNDDNWRNANQSLALQKGDCEDFAITKMQILENLGIPADRLFFVLLYDTVIQQDHAFLLVKTDEGYFALENRTDIVIPSASVRDYTPRFAFSGNRSWLFGRLVKKETP